MRSSLSGRPAREESSRLPPTISVLGPTALTLLRLFGMTSTSSTRESDSLRTSTEEELPAGPSTEPTSSTTSETSTAQSLSRPLRMESLLCLSTIQLSSPSSHTSRASKYPHNNDHQSSSSLSSCSFPFLSFFLPYQK